jgi:uncharacterized protein (UPF0332 family)
LSVQDEIQGLLDKAERFIESARLLRQHGDLASAASRLYYAMFYCAEALLLTKGLSFSKHGSAIAAYGQHFVKTGEMPAETHRWLRDALDKRQLADYEVRPILSDDDIEEMEAQAVQFLDAAREF